MRSFNTEGPVRLDDHYAIPPLERVDLEELLALRDLLNEAGEVLCVYANFEVGQAMRENLELAMRAMLDELASWALAAGAKEG